MAKVPVLSISSGFYDTDRDKDFYEYLLESTPLLEVFFDGKFLHWENSKEEIIKAINYALKRVYEDRDFYQHGCLSETLITLCLFSKGKGEAAHSYIFRQKNERKLVYPYYP